MFKLTRSSKIYILCPAGGVTGGPESLHYLAEKLRKLGHDARLVYLPREKRILLSAYAFYGFREANSVKDKCNNVLIVPEIWVNKLGLYKNIQKAIWWLSLDNFFNAKQSFDFDNPENTSIVHFAQCFYVEKFLKEHKARYVFHLQASLNRIYYRRGLSKHNRKDFIFYNPLKGFEYIELLKKEMSDFAWVPITNLKRVRLVRLLKSGKVYVDFGPHPGRDRLPREAALCGCCIIVGLRGAAQYYEDLPIPDEYKFSTQDFQTEIIRGRIIECLNEYSQRIKDFEHFRWHVSLEPRRFNLECEYIFGRQGTFSTLANRLAGIFAKTTRFFILSLEFIKNRIF